MAKQWQSNVDIQYMPIEAANYLVKCLWRISTTTLFHNFANEFGESKVQGSGDSSVNGTVTSWISSRLQGNPTDSFLATLFLQVFCHSSNILTLHLVLFLVLRGTVSFNQDSSILGLFDFLNWRAMFVTTPLAEELYRSENLNLSGFFAHKTLLFEKEKVIQEQSVT